MRKLFTILLSALALSMTACGGDEGADGAGDAVEDAADAAEGAAEDMKDAVDK